MERYLGKAIKDSGIDRSEFFLATKLWPQDYGKGSTKAAALKSMDRLSTEYLDLYLLHWPVCPKNILDPKQCISDTWRDLELLLDQERIRSIGVSNFQVFRIFFYYSTVSNCPVVWNKRYRVENSKK